MMTEGANTKYMLTDALGSVTAVYDASTSTVEFTTYDVYGNSETAPVSPYGYAGMRYAAEFDGYITPNRAYSPRLGRWLQGDPLGTTPNPQTGNVYSPLTQYSDGMNLYAYVGNEPLNSADLYGLFSTLNGCLKSMSAFCVCVDSGCIDWYKLSTQYAGKKGSKKLINLLVKWGGEIDTKGGKGSHIKIKMPNGKTVIVPTDPAVKTVTSILKAAIKC